MPVNDEKESKSGSEHRDLERERKEEEQKCSNTGCVAADTHNLTLTTTPGRTKGIRQHEQPRTDNAIRDDVLQRNRDIRQKQKEEKTERSCCHPQKEMGQQVRDKVETGKRHTARCSAHKTHSVDKCWQWKNRT